MKWSNGMNGHSLQLSTLSTCFSPTCLPFSRLCAGSISSLVLPVPRCKQQIKMCRCQNRASPAFLENLIFHSRIFGTGSMMSVPVANPYESSSPDDRKRYRVLDLSVVTCLLQPINSYTAKHNSFHIHDT